MRIPWKDIALAALTLAVATVVRAALQPWVEFRIPYVTYFVAIVFIAWRTTTPVALGSVGASWLIAAYFFIPPRFTLSLEGPGDLIGAVAYFVVTVSIVLISDRMRSAQRQSVSSEDRLELISDRLPALVSYIGRDGRYVWCNKEYTRWFGLAREQMIGRTLEEILGAEAWASVRPHIEAALSGRAVEYETEAHYVHGGTRWIHVNYTPHKADDGRILGIVAMVTDISERKHAEREATLLADLHQAFALSPSAAEAARQVTTQLVERLGLTRCLLGEIDEGNDEIRILHQHSTVPEPEDAGVYSVSDFLTDDERSLLAEGKPLVIDDVRVGRSAEAAARFLELGIGAVVSAPYVAEGRRKFALAAEKSAPYKWREDEVRLLKQVADRLYVQLDRARAQQAVRDSERRYRLLALVLTNLPLSVDRVGRFVAPQPAWSRYTGQSFEKSRGFGWFDAVHPDDREPARLAWVEALRARSPYEVRARIWHAASGSFRHAIARATPLVGENDELLEWVGACTDIHEEIEQAQALIEADRRKDEFLATLAHELRNPLAPIRNGLYILKAAGTAEGALGRVHVMLERQVKHLVRLVDDLLEVSRITHGHIELRRERTDVQAIVETAIETSRPAIDAARHQLEVDMPGEPMPLDVDPVRLSQVLTNLLNNAAKFTAPGGTISVAARREGPDAVISVRDNGRGIPSRMLSRIFDMFTQDDSGQGTTQYGLGIGLGIAKRLVELHGGTIESRSEGPGRGSEFSVRLPMVTTATGRIGADGPDPQRASPCRVLVVDDNLDAADSLGAVLTLQGYETRTAYDGRTTLEAVDDFEPAAILLDLGLPDLSGFEVAQRVRQHPRGRGVTIIALTGWGQERDRQRSREAGIDHHFAKPVNLEALGQLLASVSAGNRAA
jgi:PAS domain S-box-containing protein